MFFVIYMSVVRNVNNLCVRLCVFIIFCLFVLLDWYVLLMIDRFNYSGDFVCIYKFYFEE